MGSTHYFDTSMLNHLVDAPEGERFITAIKEKPDDRLFVSPIIIEEIKLAPAERRIKLVAVLHTLRDRLLFVKHPDALGWLEFQEALKGERFNGNEIAETDETA